MVRPSAGAFIRGGTVLAVALDLPPPPRTSFASDNAAGVDPAVMAALAGANTGSALAYGDDPWTREVEQRFRHLLGPSTGVLLCWGGTGANVVGLATMLGPGRAVVCADTAHIYVDEGGAPTRFTGSMLLPVPAPGGKLSPRSLDAAAEWIGNEHHPQAGAVSVSQATELGTVYTTSELGALAERAHSLGMLVHVDGARIANAVVAEDVTLEQMVRDTGVDVLTFGITKNGAMYGEVVLFLRPELAERARFARKQAAQLPSKARFVAAQVLALLEGDRWLDLARHANAMARRLADAVRSIDGVELAAEPEANAVFARLPRSAIRALQEWSFFWDWDPSTDLVRWMTSFATTDDDIDRFAAGIAHALAAVS